jgi:hypothetical protein
MEKSSAANQHELAFDLTLYGQFAYEKDDSFSGASHFFSDLVSEGGVVSS